MAPELHWGDIVVLAVFLMISVSIGIYHGFSGGKQQTTGEFIMADRKLPIFPTMISLFVSYLSAVGIMGLVGDTYMFGFQEFLFGPWSACLAYIIAERVFVTWIYPLKLVSINEYVYRRFKSRFLLYTVTVISNVYILLYLGVAMYAPSLAIEYATGLPIVIGVPIMAIVCTLYTAIGGMRAVIWTDVFQFFVISGGLLTVLITGMIEAGGLTSVFSTSLETGRSTSEAIHFDANPQIRNTFWGYLFGRLPLIVQIGGLSQAAVQRYSATTSIRNARTTILLLIPPSIIVNTIIGIIGLVAFTYYNNIVQCDPMMSGQVKKPDKIFVHFVMRLFKDAPGVTGLILATLYSGALSTVSSGLSGCAAIFWEDMLKSTIGKKMSEKKAALVNRALVCLCGLVAMVLAFVPTIMAGPITQIVLSLTGALNGPLLGVFLLGGLSRRANYQGAFVGLMIGIVCNLWLMAGLISLSTSSLGKVMKVWAPFPLAPTNACFPSSNTSTVISNVTSHFNSTAAPKPVLDFSLVGIENMYMISYNWYPLLGMSLAMIFGYIVSLIYTRCCKGGEEDEEPEKALMIDLSGVWPCSLCCGQETPSGQPEVKPDPPKEPITCDLVPMDDATDGDMNDIKKRVVSDGHIGRPEADSLSSPSQNGSGPNQGM